METSMGLLVGIGLSAACGFRLFVPFLGLSLASMYGFVTLGHGFEWVGTWPALIAFTAATLLEIGSYYIPWIDNLLDFLATPTAIAAGVLLTVSLTGDMAPFLRWTLAIVAGGGTSGIIQAGTVLLRGTSTSLTGGIGNWLLSTMEWLLSAVTTFLAIILPVMGLAVVLIIMVIMTRRLLSSEKSRKIRTS